MLDGPLSFGARGFVMTMSEAMSQPSAVDMLDPQRPERQVFLSPEQRKALAYLCQVHECGISLRRLNRRSLLVVLYITFTLVLSVLIVNMTAYAPASYLLLGFALGGFLHNLRILMIFRRIWPVYEAIIDWPKALRLLKARG
jgi:hypothetical protein